jgi:hypothetical protein
VAPAAESTAHDSCLAPITTSRDRTPQVTGTITRVEPDRGMGTLLGADGKHYIFRRRDMCNGWFHDLKVGASVSFEPGQHLSAKSVRSISAAV